MSSMASIIASPIMRIEAYFYNTVIVAIRIEFVIFHNLYECFLVLHYYVCTRKNNMRYTEVYYNIVQRVSFRVYLIYTVVTTHTQSTIIVHTVIQTVLCFRFGTPHTTHEQNSEKKNIISQTSFEKCSRIFFRHQNLF
jgi:hypothetical protein